MKQFSHNYVNQYLLISEVLSLRNYFLIILG